MLARLAAAIKKTPEPAPASAPAPAAQPETPPPLYTTEEEGVITNYQKEWPNIAKAKALIRRGEHIAVVQHIFTQIEEQLKPLRETLGAVAERAFLQDVTSPVNDYDQVRDKVAEWIKTQPTYLQVAYDHVAKNGTVDEVTDLINRWRKETGTVIAPPAATPPAPPPAKTELPPTPKHAVAAWAPVSSTRSTAGSANDPNDFDGAFQTFATEKV